MAAGRDREITSVCRGVINLPGVGVVLLQLHGDEDCRGTGTGPKHGETGAIRMFQVTVETTLS